MECKILAYDRQYFKIVEVVRINFVDDTITVKSYHDNTMRCYDEITCKHSNNYGIDKNDRFVIIAGPSPTTGQYVNYIDIIGKVVDEFNSLEVMNIPVKDLPSSDKEVPESSMKNVEKLLDPKIPEDDNYIIHTSFYIPTMEAKSPWKAGKIYLSECKDAADKKRISELYVASLMCDTDDPITSYNNHIKRLLKVLAVSVEIEGEIISEYKVSDIIEYTKYTFDSSDADKIIAIIDSLK